MRKATLAFALAAGLALVGCNFGKFKSWCDRFRVGAAKIDTVIAALDPLAESLPDPWQDRYADAKARLYVARTTVDTICATVESGGAGDPAALATAIANGTGAIISLLDLHAEAPRSRNIAASPPPDRLRKDMEKLHAEAEKETR